MSDAVQLLVGTRKGAWMIKSDPGRRSWRLEGPLFLGQIINHFVVDPRDPKVMLAAASTGHLGPTIQRSTDGGLTWGEAKSPPAFPAGELHGRSVHHTFWLQPGHPAEPGVWWAGASPPSLFRSADAGETWEPVKGFNEHSKVTEWFPPYDGGTPDGPMIACIVIDPRDARHMYVGTPTAGTLETTDQGETWRPLNQNVRCDYLPDPYPEVGQDTHQIALAPTNPDRIWQQNHCGIYRLDRPGERWERIGDNMPRDVGDIGFSIIPHPKCDQTAWVFPMDGTEVWPRVSPGGRPAVYRTRDGGASWERQDRGFPAEQGWFTVKRQAMCGDHADPFGLYLGTTGGEVWASDDEGESFRQIAAHLPEIYSVVAMPA